MWQASTIAAVALAAGGLPTGRRPRTAHLVPLRPPVGRGRRRPLCRLFALTAVVLGGLVVTGLVATRPGLEGVRGPRAGGTLRIRLTN